MNTSFLNYLLLFILLLILIIYLVQTTYYININNKINNNNNLHNNNLHNNNNKINNLIMRMPSNENNFLLPNYIKNTPFHIRGPVQCFHQQFNKKNNNCINLL